jgi:hypothetical protein
MGLGVQRMNLCSGGGQRGGRISQYRLLTHVKKTFGMKKKILNNL